MTSAADPGRLKRLALFFGLCLATISYALGLTVFGPTIAPLAKDLGVSEALVGALGSWMSVGYLVGSFGGISLSGRMGLRIPTIAGVLVMGAGFAWIARCWGYAGAAAGNFLYGAGGALMEIGTNAAAAELYPRHRVAALNILHVFFGLAAVVGPRFSSAQVASAAGWRGAYQMLAFAAVPAIPFLITLPFPRNLPYMGAATEGAGASRSLWREPVLWVLGAAVLFYVGAEIATNNWGVLFLSRARGWDASSAAAAISNFWLAITAGRLVLGAAGGWFGRVVKPESILLALGVGGFLLLTAFALIPADQGFLAALGPATGFFFSGIFPTLFAVGAARFPGRTAQVSAFLLGAAGLALFALAPSVGFLAEWIGIGPAFALAPLYGAALLGCIYWLWKGRAAA